MLATLAASSLLVCVSTQSASARAVDRTVRARLVAAARAAGTSTTSPRPAYPANIEYDPSGYGTYNKAALADPNIGAVDVNLNWYVVEPERGVFNFAPADKEVAAWVRAGKKVTLELRFQHETNVPAATCTSDGWLPSWEAASVPVYCELRGARGLVIPDYFSPIFQRDWRTYVATVGKHFADGPYRSDVTYARVALGLGAEAFPLLPCYGRSCNASAYRAAVHRLQAWGYSASSWLTWQESLLAYYKSVFAFTRVIYPINQMLCPATNRLNVNPATGDPVDMDVAYWAAAHGIGIGQQGLEGTYTGDYASINEIVAYIHRHFPDTYLQFQTVSEVSNKGTRVCSATCLVHADVQAAQHYGARSIEWYSADDSIPAFQSAFAAWQHFVNKQGVGLRARPSHPRP